MSRPHTQVRLFQPFAASLCTVASCLGLLAMQGCGGSVGISSTALPSTTSTSSGSGTAAISQSRLGYVWLARDQTLRPVLGVMGAAYLGESLTTGGSYIAGAASPVSQIALLVGDDGQIARMSLSDGTLVAAGAATGTAKSKVRFSPSGTSAVIYVPGGNTVTLVTGLRSTMQVHSLAAGSAVSEAAVSDAGSVVAILQAQGKALISVLHADGTTAHVATLSGSSGALSFAGTGDDLLTLDPAGNALTLVHTVSTSPNPVAIGTANLLKAPIAVGAAVTGRWAVAVNSAEASVVRVDLTGQTAPQRILCPLQPSLAEPLAYGAFRFSDAGTAPAWVTDITASTPTMFFVPALPAASASGM